MSTLIIVETILLLGSRQILQKVEFLKGSAQFNMIKISWKKPLYLKILSFTFQLTLVMWIFTMSLKINFVGHAIELSLKNTAENIV